LGTRLLNHQQEDSRREKRRAPRERKAQELRAMLQGQNNVQSGEE
jgi:hypothetical protein